jgi:hypothetical protein
MRIQLHNVENRPLEDICPPLTHAERWSLFRYVLDPETAQEPDAVAEPAIYIRGLNEHHLRCSLHDQVALLAEAGIVEARLYCDLVTDKDPLFRRAGLLRLMSDARKGLASLTTAWGLYALRPGVISSAGRGSYINWMHRWFDGAPPSAAATYTALFAGHQRSLIPLLPVPGGARVRNGRFELGYPYAPAIDHTYRMVVEGWPLDEISVWVENLVRPWDSEDPLVASLLKRLRTLASEERAHARKEAA